MAKRSQIAVGQEWAFKRTHVHAHKPWNNYRKAFIVAVEPYEMSYSKNYQVKKGNGVLVKFITSAGTEYEQVVQLSQLWKPWAEYEVAQAEYDAEWVITQKAYEIAKAEKQEFQTKVYQPAFKEFVQAVEAISGKKIYGSETVEKLPIEVIQAITEAIKEKAVA